MTSIGKLVVAIAAGTALAGSPALAVKKRVTITGTAMSGLDIYDTFGTDEDDLTGRGFTLVFDYDTSLGAFNSSASGDILLGGTTQVNPVSPFLFGSVTVNGVTKSFIPAFYGTALSLTAGNVAFSANEKTNTPAGQTDYSASFSTNSLVGAGSLTSNLGPTSFTGSVQIAGVRSAAPLESFSLSASAGTISVTNAVPEPTSWAMLIAGFGLTGAALRRTRRQVRVAA